MTKSALTQKLLEDLMNLMDEQGASKLLPKDAPLAVEIHISPADQVDDPEDQQDDGADEDLEDRLKRLG